MSPLATVGAGCWRWIAANVDDFLVRPGDDVPTRSARIVAFAELLIFTTASLRVGGGSAVPPAIVRAARDWLPAFDWESQLIRDPGFLVAIATVVEFLDACGGDAAPYRALVRAALARGIVERLQLRPYREAELDRLLVRSGFRRYDAAAFAACVRRAFRALDVPLPGYAVADLFALSHLVCYVCDDGERAAHDVVGTEGEARLRWLVSCAGRIALIDGDLDLAAEFVLCERYLGGFDPALTREAIRRAAAEQEPTGAVVAPDPGGMRSPFVRRYHSSLLWAYASLLVRQGRTPMAA
ncbi:MAG TPA: hypothetical protein VMD91_04570 [Candidatus Sulfotelmatobacter sp.]|nr:hypothetical protein [Candidatus Sulfotelmatobacter sp.]